MCGLKWYSGVRILQTSKILQRILKIDIVLPPWQIRTFLKIKERYFNIKKDNLTIKSRPTFMKNSCYTFIFASGRWNLATEMTKPGPPSLVHLNLQTQSVCSLAKDLIFKKRGNLGMKRCHPVRIKSFWWQEWQDLSLSPEPTETDGGFVRDAHTL